MKGAHMTKRHWLRKLLGLGDNVIIANSTTERNDEPKVENDEELVDTAHQDATEEDNELLRRRKTTVVEE